MSNDHPGAYVFSGNFPVKIHDHGEYNLWNHREKLSIVTEEHRQGRRKCKNELAMRKAQDHFLLKMFGKEERPFLTARRAKIKPFAGEGAEVVVTAVGVAAAYTG